MAEYKIERANAGDIDEIVAIQEESQLSEWSKKDYADELDRKDAVTLVARSNEGGVIGFATGRVVAGANERAPDSELYNIGVRSEYRRSGVGSAILREYRRICEGLRVEQIWLDVRSSNETAIEFYISHGFLGAGSRRNFYINPLEDSEIMVLPLIASGINSR